MPYQAPTPWYNQVQTYLNDYDNYWKGWFSFTQRPNYMRRSELFGQNGEKVEAVRQEIKDFDNRFFLSRWLRRPFSSIEYKRSRLFYYDSAKEIAELHALQQAKTDLMKPLPQGTPPEQAKARQAAQVSASIRFATRLGEVASQVTQRRTKVSWFSGMHRVLKNVAQLLTAERVVEMKALAAALQAPTSAASTSPVRAGGVATAPVVSTASLPASQPSAQQQPPSSSAAKAVPVSPSTALTFFGAPPVPAASRPRVATAQTEAITLLPAIITLQQVAKRRARAATVAELQQQYDDDIVALTALFAQVRVGLAGEGRAWFEAQLVGIDKAINQLLLFAYHPDKCANDCKPLATELMKGLTRFVEEQTTELEKDVHSTHPDIQVRELFTSICRVKRQTIAIYQGMTQKLEVATQETVAVMQRQDAHIEQAGAHIEQANAFIAQSAADHQEIRQGLASIDAGIARLNAKGAVRDQQAAQIRAMLAVLGAVETSDNSAVPDAQGAPPSAVASLGSQPR